MHLSGERAEQGEGAGDRAGGRQQGFLAPAPLPGSFLSVSVLLGLAERGQDLELLFCRVVGWQASRQPLAFRGALGGPRAWHLWERRACSHEVAWLRSLMCLAGGGKAQAGLCL